MSKIHILDDTLANKIAAGEVIERPLNVVKELVENSIDAKATKILIDVTDGGLGSIRIVDDGIGMSEEDAKLCFYRHATSKIKDDFDLFRITSLGFRGEAIPSIASISHFELKTSQGEGGCKVIYEYGKLIDIKKDDSKKGTEMTITKLFQNVPARLKYMKSVQTEFAQIQSFVEKIALSYPNISFRLMHQNHDVLFTKGNGNLLEVISTIYSLNVAKNMIEVDFSDDEFHIAGYISKIEVTRASKNYIMTLVNHRVVRNALTIDTVNEVYRKYLASDRYPMAFLNIEIDPFLVDVNVHPAKMEVRFSKSEQLRELLKDGLKKALEASDLTFGSTYMPAPKPQFKANFVQEEFELVSSQEEFDSPANSSFEEKHIVPDSQMIIKEEVSNYDISIDHSLLQKSEENVFDNKKEIKTEVHTRPLKRQLQVIGQARGTYILCQDDNGFYIIDQHAAKERVNYEYYLDKFNHFDKTLQDMLIPIVLEYPQSEYLLLKERKDVLLEVGIDLQPFGQSSFVVKQLPLWMRQIDEQLYIESMVSQVLHANRVDVLELRKDAIATLSCKASVKGNTFLTTDNLQHIVNELMRCDNPYVCPHGRPTMISYTDYELEKLFKRVV